MKESLTLKWFILAVSCTIFGCFCSRQDEMDDMSIKCKEVEWVSVQGGSFRMGDTFGDGEDRARPDHAVTVSNFYIGKYEVTFNQYDAFCDATQREKPDDKGWGRGNRPVIRISWNDANAFCEWMSKRTGQAIRLPTEAEWEFAAKGGIQSKGYKYSGSNHVDEVAWIYSNSGMRTQPVGLKKPNELKLYDMSGNMWEWCSDWYDETHYSNSPERNPEGPSTGVTKTLRGGSWGNGPNHMRCDNRDGSRPGYKDNSLGFRCVKTE